jgi:GTP cyclohydrolase IA
MPDKDELLEEPPPPIDPIDALAHDQIEAAIQSLLTSVGEDPQRDGLRGTPARVARMYAEVLSGYHTDPVALLNGALFEVDYDEMVVVKSIEYYSLCEHHLLPFYGHAHVAYVPRSKVLGLSKIPRVVDMFARRLQVQERMTRQIADFLESALHPQGIAVVVEGAHLCAMMRGVKKANARMVTSSLMGRFKSDARTRAEFFEHVRGER